MSPTVSVILLSFNQAEYLRSAVASVEAQTFTDWELLIVDNGSTDGSHELLAAYANHPRIRLFLHRENQYPTRRLNQALAEARGAFVSLLYSDDYYLPEKLARQMALFDGQPDELGVVYSPGRRLNVDNGREWTDVTPTASGFILPTLLRELHIGYINPISPLIRRACFARHPFYEDLFIEGEQIMLRMAVTHRFLFDATPTVVMRDHQRNIGRALTRNIPRILACLERLRAQPGLSAADAQLLDRVLVRCFRNWGWMVLRVANDADFARDMFQRGLRADWRQILHPKTAIGLGLARLPAPARAQINRTLFRLRRPPGHIEHVTE